MHATAIIPTHVRVTGTRRIPFDMIRTHTPMDRRLVSIRINAPELEPELTPDETIGVEVEAPRQPLPLEEILANLDRLAASGDPTLMALARQVDLAEIAMARACYDAWELRQ